MRLLVGIGLIVAVGAGIFAISLGKSRHGVPSAGSAIEPTVASLTPAGTDLIIGIGAARHLVAVSDLDENRAGAEGLPRIGDFNHVDWEKLAEAAPKILVTQFGGRLPPVVSHGCAEQGVKLIDVRLNVLEDVYEEADRLGDALGEQIPERQAVKELKARLAAVAARRTGAGIPTAIAVSDGGTVGLIGPGSFHDELLTIAGGVNVTAGFHKPFVVIDREQLSVLAPEVVLDLEPTPPTTPQQMAQLARFWASMPDLPAVRSRRVFVVTEPYCLRPAWHLAELAEVFSLKLGDGGPAPKTGD